MNTNSSPCFNFLQAACLAALSVATLNASGALPVQQAYVKASNTEAGASYGLSVAVSGDTMVVGAHRENGLAFNAGAAYVYVRNGTTWSQQAYLKASNAEDTDVFGFSVAISGDTIVVGAPFEDSNAKKVNGNENQNGADQSGAAYVFVRNGTTWTQQAYLKASNGEAGDEFGFSVAISGDTAVVSAARKDTSETHGKQNPHNVPKPEAGAAYVFVRNGTTWSEQAYLTASDGVGGDHFGWSVAVSGDTAILGAHTKDGETGAAYVFVRNGTEWTQQASLQASNAEAGDFFGSFVGISGDTIVVGAGGEGSSATGVNGDQSNNGAFHSGAAYVFVRTGTNWAQQAYLKASNTEAGDAFGTVAISGDTVVVGAQAESSGATGINGDQNDNSSMASGAAYVFVRNGTTWSQQAYLKASNTGTFDVFGVAVAVSGDTVVVSAYLEDSGATGVNGNENDNSVPDSGAAYVFVGLGPGL